jgi:16S rRNA (adenine1518-N6/adenine1519-N6)-dimethyltransferase
MKGARLGQHFLNNPWAAEKMVAALSLHEGESVLEIGPGAGALTRVLLETGARVTAVEKDERLVQDLHAIFPAEIAAGRLHIIESDIRDFDPGAHALGNYSLAANIPYYITGEIIRQFLTANTQPTRIALLIQKEVADRIVATKGSMLSVSVRAYGEPLIIAKVSRGHFSPPPSVDSAIILIEKISRAFFIDVDESIFFRVVRAGFASKRKFLANNLAPIFGKERVADIFAACAISPSARAENLSMAEWKLLAQHAH